MKKVLRPVWIIYCIILIPVFVVSCFSAFISPASFSYISLFAIAFPYIFILVLISSIISFYIKKRMGIILLICLLPGLYNLSHIIAFNFPGKANAVKKDSTLRIMTWNVQDFVDFTQKSDVSSRMLQLINQKNPDMVCIQEFTNVEGAKRRISIREKMDSLGYAYHFFSNDDVYVNKNNVVVMKGVAVFSKIPFTDSGRINIKKSETNENLIYVNINFNNKPLRIYTAHLASFGLYKDTGNTAKDIYEITYTRKRAIQYKLRDVEQLHQKEVEIINAEISNTSLPVVYCGDMNAVPSSYNYRTLKNDLQDAFLEKGFGIGVTFYKIAPTLRIDYCLADKRFKIINCTVINQKLSDHYPVLTDMQWK